MEKIMDILKNISFFYEIFVNIIQIPKISNEPINLKIS